MASNRHLGRIVALQTLYELDFRIEVKEKNLDQDAILKRNIDRYSEVVGDKDFISDLVNGVLKKAKDLDVIIQPVAPDWPIDQIARVDRTILRMGVYELHFNKSVPAKVAINEAVELAKSFGADNSSKFVNGVLGTVLKHIDAEADSASDDKAPEVKPKTKVAKAPVKKSLKKVEEK
ncbi:MAG: N utilization substance protein B [Candidatus Saccharimonadales bacterium]|jgi:N utilization substance protein B